MPISNQIGASRLIQPGVVDSAAARPASPYEGQVIFQKDTDQLLVWNGTAWVIPNAPAQNPDGLELIRSATFTATTDLIIDTIFSSIYTNYKIFFMVDTVSAAVGINTQLRDVSGNLITSYYYSGVASDLSSTTVTRDSGNNTASFLACVPYQNFNYGSLTLELMRPNETAYTMFNYENMNYRPTSLIEWRKGSGAYQQTTAVTGIRFFSGSATTFAGKYRVYGYRD